MRDSLLIRESVRRTSHVGGSPRAGAGESWPLCESCREAMQFFAELSSRELTLRGADESILAFWCPNDAGLTAHGADPRTTRVLRVPPTSPALAVPSRSQPFPTTLPSSVSLRTEPVTLGDTDDERIRRYQALMLERGDVLGLTGKPIWIQEDQTPGCERCDQPMELVAQLESDTAGLQLGDAGIAYVFRCRSCVASGALVIQRT